VAWIGLSRSKFYSHRFILDEPGRTLLPRLEPAGDPARQLQRSYRLEKSWHFGKFAERNHTNNKSEGHNAQSRFVVSPTALAATLERPGAVATYLSMPVSLICVGLSAIGSTKLQGASLCILCLNIVLGILLILVDEIGSCRNHGLGLLRFSAVNSRARIEKLGIKSKQIDRFINALWLNPELEHRFRRKGLQSVELMVQALDILSRTASRYRRRGKKVFEVNEDAIINAMRLFECLPLADAEEVLVGPLKGWLELPPEYDPEGWALPLFGKF
jgi:hypothetical protein